MRTPSYDIVQTDEMLQKCFSYLVDSGLENISMRKMCEETGIAMSSAYYWFKNKDDMILNATAWGLDNVATRLFDYVFKYIDNLEIVIIAFSEYAMKYKKELRFVYQVVTSNKYGSEIRPIANRLLNIYEWVFRKNIRTFSLQQTRSNSICIFVCVSYFGLCYLERQSKIRS